MKKIHIGRFAKQKIMKTGGIVGAVFLVAVAGFFLTQKGTLSSLIPDKEEAADTSKTIDVSLAHRDNDPNAWTRGEKTDDLDDTSNEEILDLSEYRTGFDDFIVSLGQLENDSKNDTDDGNAEEYDSSGGFCVDPESDGVLYVSFLDVGQGDSVLISYKGQEEQCSMLIDAGDNHSGTKVRKYIKDAGVENLDYVVCTHPDEDHIGGMASVIENVPISSATVWIPDIKKDTKTYDNLVNEAERNNLKMEMPELGREYRFGDAVFIFFAPNEKHEDENNNSLVMKLSFGSRSYLFTGDCEDEEEQELLSGSYADQLKSDVLKVGHHGSFTSTGEKFLQAVSPTNAVISCGKDNMYHHPSNSVLDLLKEVKCRVYRTDMDGTIYTETDGNTLLIYDSHTDNPKRFKTGG